MKQKLSICIFAVICFGGIILTTVVINSNRQQHTETKIERNVELKETEVRQIVKQKEYIPTQKELMYYSYMIYQDGERLTVYKADSTTVFMETNILVDQLPDDVQEQLKMGIGFQTEDDLYDFLESYSS